MNSKGKTAEQMLLFLMFFTEMFSFTIGGFNTRYILVAFWFVVGLIRCKRFVIYKYCFHFVITLMVLIGYSTIVLIANGSQEYFIILRLARAVVTCCTLNMFISSTTLSKDKILDIVELILLLHGICIILEIISPGIKEIVQPISQYDKEFMRLRAPGFLSGYDDAGLLLVIGLAINYFRNKAKNVSDFSIKSIIYIVAVVFASRISMMLMIVLVLYIIIAENRKGTWKSKMLAAIAILIGGFVVVILWILTTDVALTLREELMVQYPFLRNLQIGLMESYTDYGTYRWQRMTRHWSPEPITWFQYIFGKGSWPPNSDIGYIKNIYAAGIVSVIISVATYLLSIRNVRLAGIRNNPDNITYNKYHLRMYLFIVILMMAMELKISILFSSTSFELLSIIYFVEILPKD